MVTANMCLLGQWGPFIGECLCFIGEIIFYQTRRKTGAKVAGCLKLLG